jgi:hypothetical protein
MFSKGNPLGTLPNCPPPLMTPHHFYPMDWAFNGVGSGAVGGIVATGFHDGSRGDGCGRASMGGRCGGLWRDRQ